MSKRTQRRTEPETTRKFYIVCGRERTELTQAQYQKLYNMMVPHMTLEMREALRAIKGDAAIALDPDNRDAYLEMLNRLME